MSVSDPRVPPTGAPAHLNLLLIDESDIDRNQLYRILGAVTTKAGEIHQAATLGGAWEIAQTLDHLEAIVAGIPKENGDGVFDLRDRLVDRFGPVATAFCSREDMSPYYDRVIEGEMLFFKPVNDEVMRDWLAANTGMELKLHGGEPIAAESAAEAVGFSQDAGAGDAVLAPSASGEPIVEEEEPDPVWNEAGMEELATGQEIAADGVGEVVPEEEPPGPVPGLGEALPDGLLRVGTQLGDYRLLSIIQSDDDLAMYEAEQISIGRRVALKTLFRRHRTDPDWVGTFAHEARARALVSHPNISLVYEADQDRGVTYYTLELIDGPNLAQLAAAGSDLDDATLWRILKVVANVLHYLKEQQMEHRMISADTIFLVGEGQPRIANPVKPGVPVPEEDSAQMRLIAEAIRPFVRGSHRADRRLVALLDRMSNPARVDGVKSGHGLSEAIRHLEDQALHPPSHAVIEQRSNRAAIVSGIVVGLLIVVSGLIWQVFFGSRPVAKPFDTMIRVPDGAFVYQNGEKIELPVFWIDEFEVTYGQYAEFLAAIAADPTLLPLIRHPDQPAEKKSHRPKNWEEYYETAIRGGNISGAKIDPNCPVTDVDWWDAHAYARWKGNRLPTDQEWEKAARGPEGLIYPWGNDLDLARFNSGADQDAESNGNKDGYRYWSPVDAFPTDESRYGVKGMAGNVSEWTDTWDTDPDNPDRKVPIKRGASFATKGGYELTARRPAKSAEEASLWTGFRTARSEPPPPAGTPPPRPAEQPSAAPEAAAPTAGDAPPAMESSPAPAAPAPATDADGAAASVPPAPPAPDNQQ
jgi:formylglycine-generating enzyme required for sulfatase activity